MKPFCLFTAFLLLFPITGILAGAPRFPDEFFAFRKIEHPDRTYFEELSDSEYDSIAPGPSFYPFILDVWPDRPIRLDTFFYLRSPEYTKDDSVRLQNDILANSIDPHALSMTYSYLAACRNPTAAAIARPYVPRYDDPHTLADALHIQVRYAARWPLQEITPYFAHTERRVRILAIRLFALQPDASPALLFKQLEAESDPAVRAELCKAALRLLDKTRFADWKALLDGQDQESLALAIPALMSFREVSGEQAKLLQISREGSVPVRFALARNCHTDLNPTLAAELLKILAVDEFESVRIAAAEAIGRLRLKSRLEELLKLAEDSRPGVRRAAAENLQAFPVKSAFDRLILLTGDRESPFTRDAAQASLTAIADSYPVDQELAPHLSHANEHIRYNTCRVLRDLQSTLHKQALEQNLNKEDLPRVQAALIRALTAAGAIQAESAILRHANSPDPDVRTAVAEAIGSLNLAKGYDVISRYALTDKEEPVRFAAIVSMGQTGENRFSEPLLSILKRTNYTGDEYLTSTDRSAVCWSVARLANPSQDLLNRMAEHVTRPVVLYPMSPPSFDSSDVQVSAIWAFASIGKRDNNEDNLQQAHRLLQFVKRASQSESSDVPVGNAMLYYMNQCRLFLDGAAMPRKRLDLQVFRFNLQPIPPALRN